MITHLHPKRQGTEETHASVDVGHQFATALHVTSSAETHVGERATISNLANIYEHKHCTAQHTSSTSLTKCPTWGTRRASPVSGGVTCWELPASTLTRPPGRTKTRPRPTLTIGCFGSGKTGYLYPEGNLAYALGTSKFVQVVPVLKQMIRL